MIFNNLDNTTEQLTAARTRHFQRQSYKKSVISRKKRQKRIAKT